MTAFQQKVPCHSTELVHFRQRIGPYGFEKIFQMSVRLHGRAALEKAVYPHACGEQTGKFTPGLIEYGLSPRMWGTGYLCSRFRFLCLFISTPQACGEQYTR